jgi:hypothetical protein
MYMDRFVTHAEPGLLLLHGYGNVFQKTLQPGEKILVEPGGFLYKDSSVTMNAVQQNVKTGLMSRGMYLAEMTGPGRVGIQSMYGSHRSATWLASGSAAPPARSAARTCLWRRWGCTTTTGSTSPTIRCSTPIPVSTSATCP